MTDNNKALTSLAVNGTTGLSMDENGKPNLTLGNLTRGIKNLEKGKVKVDYTIALVLNSISKLDKSVFTSAGYDNFVDYCTTEFVNMTKGHVYKLCQVAEQFLTIENPNELVGLSTTSHETGLVTSDGRNVDIALNTSAVKGLQDIYGFPFSITQMQEMATLKMEEIVELIQSGKVKASMSCSGKNSIRDVVRSLKHPNEEEKTEKAKGNVVNNNGEIKLKVSQDKERFQAIIDIISMVEMDVFNTSPVTKSFVEFLQECAKNSNK